MCIMYFMRVLIVEDDIELAASLKKGLELSSYAVDIVHDGRSGEAYAISGEYDAAIVDWMLPEQSGIELCRAVRRSSTSLPIILLTAKDTIKEKIEGLDAGADDYIPKPFAFAELLARLRAILRRPSNALPTMLTLGDITFDTTSRETKRSGQHIPLSVRESAILELFLRYPNRVFTKEQIVSQVWDGDSNVLATTVESHIANLRAKLDKSFEVPVIKTVWGKGYTTSHESFN